MPLTFNPDAIDRYRRLDEAVAKLAWERYHKYPYQLSDEQYKEILKEIRKQQREERKKAAEKAKEEAAEETWRMSAEDYLRYIAEQKEKQRLLRMVRR